MSPFHNLASFSDFKSQVLKSAKKNQYGMNFLWIFLKTMAHYLFIEGSTNFIVFLVAKLSHSILHHFWLYMGKLGQQYHEKSTDVSEITIIWVQSWFFWFLRLKRWCVPILTPGWQINWFPYPPKKFRFHSILHFSEGSQQAIIRCNAEWWGQKTMQWELCIQFSIWTSSFPLC